MASIKFNFTNKVILVTGGAQGIGRQIAEDFLSSGAKVIVWDHSEEKLKELEKDLQNSSLVTRKVDVSIFKECEEGAQHLNSKIDILVNNAGILRDRSLAKMTEKEYLEVMETNLNGVFYVTKSLLPHFNEKSLFKRIVNLASVVAIYGNFGQTNYVAAKAGVIGFTKVWARELGKKGFTVNAIAPGFIQTDILKNIPNSALDAHMIQRNPLARLGTVEEHFQRLSFLMFRRIFLYQW